MAASALERFSRLRSLARESDATTDLARKLDAEAWRGLADATPVRVSVARQALGVSDNTVRGWIKAGRLRPVSAHPLRVSLADVAELREEARGDFRPANASTLADWVARGLVRGRPLADRVELAAAERAYVTRHADLLQRLVETAEASPADLVVLFGSVARGDDGPASDVDLLVAGELDDLELRRLAAALEEELERNVDVVDLASAERQPWLLLTVVNDGRVVVDRGTAWPTLQRQRHQLVHSAEESHAQLLKEARIALADMKAGA